MLKSEISCSPEFSCSTEDIKRHEYEYSAEYETTQSFQMHKRPNGTLFFKKLTKILPYINGRGRRISAANVSHGERFNRQNETSHKIKLSKTKNSKKVISRSQVKAKYQISDSKVGNF